MRSSWNRFDQITSYIFAIEEQFDCKKFDEIHGDDQKFIECDANNNVLPYGMTSGNIFI